MLTGCMVRFFVDGSVGGSVGQPLKTEISQLQSLELKNKFETFMPPSGWTVLTQLNSIYGS